MTVIKVRWLNLKHLKRWLKIDHISFLLIAPAMLDSKYVALFFWIAALVYDVYETVSSKDDTVLEFGHNKNIGTGTIGTGTVIPIVNNDIDKKFDNHVNVSCVLVVINKR